MAFPRPKMKPHFSRSRHKIGLPYPNYGLGETELPSICKCYYDGQEFFVTHEKDMHILYQNGAFGTSSRTFRGPSGSMDPDFQHQPYYRKRFENNSKYAEEFIVEEFESDGISNDVNCTRSDTASTAMDITEPTEGCANGINLEDRGKLDESKMNINGEHPDGVMITNDDDKFVINAIKVDGINCDSPVQDCGREGAAVKYSKEANVEVEERLILLPEEVIFLSFAVGCISIQDAKTGENLTFQQIWKILVCEHPEFPYFYAVYHYFRSKNWVPREGRKFGGDYVLYKIGPQFYHSTYIVHMTGLPSRPEPNWTEVYGWQRVGLQTQKYVLLCNLDVPLETVFETSTPRCIFTLKLNETVIFRWTTNAATDWDCEEEEEDYFN